jgi:hypothetical protein
MNIDEIFLEKKLTPSDINEHLEILHKYALDCETIAEFGVRDIVSAFAFAKAKPKKLICVDIISPAKIEEFVSACKARNIDCSFFKEDTLKFSLENVDLLFIDTWHSYNQLKNELKIHSSKVNKYIIMHDTVSFAFTNEQKHDYIPNNNHQEKSGLIPAIYEFLFENTNWKIKEEFKNNNGLMVLEKC